MLDERHRHSVWLEWHERQEQSLLRLDQWQQKAYRMYMADLHQHGGVQCSAPSRSLFLLGDSSTFTKSLDGVSFIWVGGHLGANKQKGVRHTQFYISVFIP